MLGSSLATVTTAIAFTLGAFVIARAGRYAETATTLLASIAIGLGMLALIGELSRLDAEGPAISQADARPEFGMSWRPPANVPSEQTRQRP